MAKGKESFERRQRERAKKAKADMKRERRLSRDDTEPDEPAEPKPVVDEEAVLAQLAKLHQDFEDEKVAFEDFEERRAELLARLQVD